MSDSCNPMDCSLRGSSVYGILQARILVWVAISFSRGSSQPRDRTRISRASLLAQLVKNRPASAETQEMRVRFLGWEDPLEKEMATHTSILAWGILWTEEPSGLHFMESGVTKSSTVLSN